MTKEEFEQQVKELVEAIGDNTKLKPGQNNKIFELHNEAIAQKWIAGPYEHGKSCAGCVKRTFGRLQKYYNDNLK